MDQIKASYYLEYKLEEESLQDFLHRQFNPHNRGLLTVQVGEHRDRTKVLAEHYSLVCVKANEDESIKAVSFRETKGFQYHFALEKGHILQGDWEFSTVNEARKSLEVDEDGQEESLSEEIEEIQQNLLLQKEFKEFEDYWNQLDLVNQYSAESLKSEKKKSITGFSHFNMDLDRYYFKIKLKSSDYYFSNGTRIRLCSQNAWNNHYELTSKDPDKIYSKGIGTVVNYDRRNSWLTVEAYSSDVIKDMAKDKTYASGYVWIDDIGSRSIIARQKQALQQLFNRETANKQLKDIIPEADIISPLKGQELKEEFLSEDFYKKFTLSQQEAVKGALSENDLYLIQGPPGTGKTTVINEIIEYLLRSGKKVLLSSQTNLAVDNVLQRIGWKEDVHAIRIGNEEKFELDSENYSLINRVKELQQNIITQLSEREQEIQQAQIEYKKTSEYYESHEKIEENIKRIVNTQVNHNEKVIEKEKNLDVLTQKQEEISDLREFTSSFEEKYDGQIHLFEELNLALLESSISIEENIQNAVLASVLHVHHEDLYSINIYIQMVDEILKKVAEKEEIGKRIEESIQSTHENQSKLRVYEKRLEELRSRGINGNLPHHLRHEAKDVRERLEYSLIQIKEHHFRLNGFIDDKGTLDQQINSLMTEVEEHKKVIESYISKNTIVWNRLYQKNDMKKSEFIEIITKKTEFEKEFHHLKHAFHMFPDVKEYMKYAELVNRIEQLHNERSALTKELNKIDKYINAFKESLERFKQEEYVQSYLNYYQKSFNKLEVKEEMKTVALFRTKHHALERRIYLHNLSKEIQTDWASQLNYYQESFENVYIHISNLICATCLGISANHNNHFHSTEFDYVIIDEAARSSSLELLIPMTRGKKIVLVGDHKQLSPHVDDEIMRKIASEQDFSDDELDALFKHSMFGLMYPKISEQLKTFLDEQFRMHQDISKVVSTYFYDQKLLDHRTIKDKMHSLEKHLPKGFYWLNTPNLEEFEELKEGTSFWNKGEVTQTIHLLQWLDDHLRQKKEIGIIAPYSIQKHKLEQALRDYTFSNINLEINTVDAFQGREKHIIIMNLVRNNHFHSIGHIANYARVNVAISRAQELMIIIGNEDFVANNRRKASKLFNVVQHLKRQNSVIESEAFLQGEVVTHES